MELKFFSSTVWRTSCVEELVKELKLLEADSKAWDFPYSITIVIRCGTHVGKTFRRFDKSRNDLGVDIREECSQYISYSKNEQRERLGKLLFSYLSESIKKYPRYAAKTQQADLISKIEQWMLDHNWLHGKIEQARILLQDHHDTFEVSQLLDLSLEEVEDIFFRMYESGERTGIHADNIRVSKAMFL